jgi:hypothetical protein
MSATVSKKRLYKDNYIDFGFSFIESNGKQQPQCVICHCVLSNDAMRPVRLERHLSTNHPALKDKPKEFFVSKLSSIKKMKLDAHSSFVQDNDKAVLASYELALLIAKDKKAHTIGETLVKPCLLLAANIVLGDASRQKLSKISLSDNTVKRRIDDIANDIKKQVMTKVKDSPFFAIQCDETTDLAQCCQLLVYCRFMDEGTLNEEMLFSKCLTTTSTASDVFSTIDTFFQENGLSWEKVVGVCTDGAPSMIGSRSGFMKMAKDMNKSIRGTHCLIHRQALAAKTLPQDLNNALKVAIQVVNYVKTSSLNTRLFQALCEDLQAGHKNLLFHTEVRWLSKGNMLARLYELKQETETFLKCQDKTELYNAFTDIIFHLSLAYLTDFFEALNNLNLTLQGRNSNLISSYDAIRAFLEKIQLWKRRLESKNLSSFPRLNELVDEKGGDTPKAFVDNIKSHLDSLSEEFSIYFPDISSDDWSCSLTRNPFIVDINLLPQTLQEEAIELKCNSGAKDDFKTLTLSEFWVHYFAQYPLMSKVALSIIVPFSSTYLCESGFSALTVIKTKQRCRLEIESDLRCSLSHVKPNIANIIKSKK